MPASLLSNQKSIFKVVRFYDPNNQRQKLTNYYRGSSKGKNITYIDYITRKEACILRALPEKALREENEANEWYLESLQEWKQKWFEKGVSEEFLNSVERIMHGDEFGGYGWDFKTKLFNHLDEKGTFNGKGFGQKLILSDDKKIESFFGLNKNEMSAIWNQLKEIEREKFKKSKWIELLKEAKWGTGLYSNSAQFKTKKGSNFGELSKKELLGLKKDFFEMRNDKDRLMWDTVLSFDTEFAERNNLLTPEVVGGLIEKNIQDLFVANHLDPKRMTWGFAMHGNTKNPHAHLFFYENKPNRNGTWHYKGALKEESMVEFYKRIEIQAQTQELKFEKLKLAEYETSFFLTEKITNDFFLSKKQRWAIHKDVLRIKESQIKIETLNLNLQKLKNQFGTELEIKNTEELIKKETVFFMQRKEDLMKQYSFRQLKLYFDSQFKKSEIETEIMNSYGAYPLPFKKYGSWEQLKRVMVKKHSVVANEDLEWLDRMEGLLKPSQKTLKYSNLTKEGQILAAQHISNFLSRSEQGAELFKKSISEIEIVAKEVVNSLNKIANSVESGKMQHLQFLDGLEKMKIDVDYKRFAEDTLNLQALDNEAKKEVYFAEIKRTLLEGKNGFFAKQTDRFISELQNLRAQSTTNAKSNLKAQKPLSAKSMKNTLKNALMFGSTQAASEFNHEMKKLRKRAEKEIKQFENERMVRE